MSEEEVVGEGWCTTVLPSDSRSCLTVTEILWKSQQMSTPASGSGWGHWGRLHEFRKCSMYSCFGLSLFLRSAVHSNMVKTPRRDTCSCLTFFLCFQNVFVHPYSIFQTMCPESWNWCKRLRSVFCLFVFLMKWNTQWNRNSHSVSLSGELLVTGGIFASPTSGKNKATGRVATESAALPGPLDSNADAAMPGPM